MSPGPPNPGTQYKSLGITERMDVCKARMIRAFNHEWLSSRNRERAYSSGFSTLERAIERFKITNPRVRMGLVGELVYYYQKFKEHHLTPITASGHHFDFAAIINGRPAGVDVSTNPAYKRPEKFQEVREAFSM